MMGLGKDQQMQKGDDWDEDAAPVSEGRADCWLSRLAPLFNS